MDYLALMREIQTKICLIAIPEPEESPFVILVLTLFGP
jgi:hypothetical protein